MVFRRQHIFVFEISVFPDTPCKDNFLPFRTLNIFLETEDQQALYNYTYCMAIFNKKAGFEYFLYERFEAGIVLLGGEVKSVRSNNVDLSNSFARFIDGELFLVNANIPIDGKKDYEPTRMRKLLLHKSECVSIKSKIQAKKLTLVPVKMYNTGRLIKVELALAKSKRKFEKRESIKEKDIERDLEEQFKDRG